MGCWIPGEQDDQFPIHYEDERVVVYTNPSKEVFVSLKNADPCLRITPSGGLLKLSTYSGGTIAMKQGVIV